MAVQLKPETERLVQQEIERGHFHTADEVIVQAILALNERSNPDLRSIKKQPLGQFLLASPLRNSGLMIERSQDFPEPIEL